MSEPPSRSRCPICGKPLSAAYAPFCSARCVQLDLGRWLDGTYRIESDETPDDLPDPPG